MVPFAHLFEGECIDALSTTMDALFWIALRFGGRPVETHVASGGTFVAQVPYEAKTFTICRFQQKRNVQLKLA